MTYPRTAPLAIAVLLFLLAQPARAGLLDWTASWSITPEVSATSGGSGKIILTAEGPLTHTGSSNVTAATLTPESTALLDTPAIFSNASFTLVMTLKDETSGASTPLTFTGEFNGALTRGMSTVTTTGTGLTSQVAPLGNNIYTVTIGPFLDPGAPNPGDPASSAGLVSVDVTVTPKPTPEPSALLLAGLGIGAVALRRFRRRR